MRVGTGADRRAVSRVRPLTVSLRSESRRPAPRAFGDEIITTLGCDPVTALGREIDQARHGYALSGSGIVADRKDDGRAECVADLTERIDIRRLNREVDPAIGSVDLVSAHVQQCHSRPAGSEINA